MFDDGDRVLYCPFIFISVVAIASSLAKVQVIVAGKEAINRSGSQADLPGEVCVLKS